MFVYVCIQSLAHFHCLLENNYFLLVAGTNRFIFFGFPQDFQRYQSGDDIATLGR